VGKSEQRKRLTPLLPRVDPVLSANYTADNKAALSFPRAPSNGFMINLAFLPRQIIGSIPVIINSRARARATFTSARAPLQSREHVGATWLLGRLP